MDTSLGYAGLGGIENIVKLLKNGQSFYISLYLNLVKKPAVLADFLGKVNTIELEEHISITIIFEKNI